MRPNAALSRRSQIQGRRLPLAGLTSKRVGRLRRTLVLKFAQAAAFVAGRARERGGDIGLYLRNCRNALAALVAKVLDEDVGDIWSSPLGAFWIPTGRRASPRRRHPGA
jgi:hypothetical protein